MCLKIVNNTREKYILNDIFIIKAKRNFEWRKFPTQAGSVISPQINCSAKLSLFLHATYAWKLFCNFSMRVLMRDAQYAEVHVLLRIQFDEIFLSTNEHNYDANSHEQIRMNWKICATIIELHTIKFINM